MNSPKLTGLGIYECLYLLCSTSNLALLHLLAPYLEPKTAHSLITVMHDHFTHNPSCFDSDPTNDLETRSSIQKIYVYSNIFQKILAVLRNYVVILTRKNQNMKDCG